MICGTAESLEIDHIDPATKELDVGKMWAVSEERLMREVKKCQLLCKEHHKEKTLRDKGLKSARETHGTLSSYRYCKCALCRRAKNEYNREYKRRKRV